MAIKQLAAERNVPVETSQWGSYECVKYGDGRTFECQIHDDECVILIREGAGRLEIDTQREPWREVEMFCTRLAVALLDTGFTVTERRARSGKILSVGIRIQVGSETVHLEERRSIVWRPRTTEHSFKVPPLSAAS